jgi:hypothetical protein
MNWLLQAKVLGGLLMVAVAFLWILNDNLDHGLILAAIAVTFLDPTR